MANFQPHSHNTLAHLAPESAHQSSSSSSDIKMMASLVIDSIRSALNDLERFDCIDYYKDITKKQLKNLEIFVLYARKLGNDAQLRFGDGKMSTLGSLLQKIHDALPANPCPYFDWQIPSNFERITANLREEIVNWYDTLSVSLPPPTLDEVMIIIDSVLMNLDLICCNYWDLHNLIFEQLREAMIQKITFLRNFILFATLRSVEPRQLLDNLFVHIQALAVDVARTSYIRFFQEYMELYFPEYVELKFPEYVELNFPVLLQTMKIVDPCSQILISSKLSTQLPSSIPDKDHDSLVIMKDFIDSLMWNLWERLHTDTPIVISTNSELQLVYEGLRLLRIMLKEQPNKFDKKIRELTRVVICDAGVIIFCIDQKDMEIFVPDLDLLQMVKGKDFSVLDLLQRISRIKQRVEGKDLSIPDLLGRIHGDLPRTNELGFIDFVLENLLGMTSSKASYCFQSQFRMIHDELCLLRCSLGEIEEVRNEQKDLEALWNAGVKVAYRVEFLIDQLVFGYFQDSSSTSFDSTVKDILKEVKRVKSNILPASDIKVKKVSMTPNPLPSQNRGPITDEIVGLVDDITSIIDRLTRGSKQLKMVAIVGMPGIGKTTLATKVFNHTSVTSHFHVRLQCCVSQLFHKKNLLLELLKQVDPSTQIEMSEYDLTEKLRRHLKRKRYLIVLDDVWDIEVWDSLKGSFPNDRYESRILVTSRIHDAVPKEGPWSVLDGEPLSPRLLTEDQSWELLRKRLPPRIEWSPALGELGKQIAANCKGLPLTIVVVAGLLANMEPQGWKMFLESIGSFSGANHCMNILELSYEHLPGHLKQCFLYFGLFPEDHEVSANRLIRLWIAEGFVRKTESKRLEDAARDYLMDLVGRSLIIVSKERSRGGAKAYRIHDLLHDFCRTKANEENFSRLLKGGYDEFLTLPKLGYVRRLCVHLDAKAFQNLRLFCPHLHSLLCFSHDVGLDNEISLIIPRCRRLRVLDINQYRLHSWIISEIGLFLQLKYLSVSAEYLHDIPSSIGSLTNLETFILCLWGQMTSLPDTFWNLQKLRHVKISRCFHLAFENLEKFPDLCELQSCSCATIFRGESIERLVRKFPNIRKLSIDLPGKEGIETLKLDSLSKLESLHLSLWRARYTIKEEDFDFPDNLRKLSLTEVWLRQSVISRIGKLPNLEVLKLHGAMFDDYTWEMVEGEFSTLKFLELNNMSIVRWTASDDQFPCLRKFVLEHCRRVSEIPCCFESIDTLEMVRVIHCGDYVDEFFRRIQDQQTELGNSFLKIQFSERYVSEDESEDE